MGAGGVTTDTAEDLPVERQIALTETLRLRADTSVFLNEQGRGWLAAQHISSTWNMKELLSKNEEIISKGKLKIRMIIGLIQIYLSLGSRKM